MLSTKTIPIKNLEDPKIEAFVYNIFLIKSEVTLQQKASVMCQNHRLKEIRGLL